MAYRVLCCACCGVLVVVAVPRLLLVWLLAFSMPLLSRCSSFGLRRGCRRGWRCVFWSSICGVVPRVDGALILFVDVLDEVQDCWVAVPGYVFEVDWSSS